MESTPPGVLAQPPVGRRLVAAVVLVAFAVPWLLNLARSGSAFDVVYFGAGLLTCLAGAAVAGGRALVYRRDTWQVALVALPASLLGPLSPALMLLLPVRRAVHELPSQLRTARRELKGRDRGVLESRHSGSVMGLLLVLLLHGFGALMWVALLGFSADAGTDRQFNQALWFGAVTWSIATVSIVLLWRSRKLILWVPFAWWISSFLLMIAVVYGWN